jgi:precorrin-6Y C5,15-methyltransferase (decarboxylating)
MTAWLSIVGIGADGLSGVTPAAQALVAAAEVLVGGTRHLAMVAEDGAERLTWETPLSRTVDAIQARRGRRVVVLASGDPMWFGIGVTLARRFPREEIAVLPHLSAFNLAAAHMGWPLAEVEAVTLHGRPLDLLALHLAPGARLLMLSENGETPARVATYLRDRGWGPSTITVLENLGAADERAASGTAAQWNAGPCADLNTIAVACAAGPGTRVLSRTPGLPDDAFTHDGQITKREVRAATLSALAPQPGQLLWDVGAGCGSVGIEWMRAARGARAIAIERDASRQSMIAQNAAALGVPQLRVLAGTAPDALRGLDAPDAIFVGGDVSDAMIETCWSALKRCGRLVANAVTIDGETSLVSAHARRGGALSRIAVSRADTIGSRAAWRPLMPVTQWAATKTDG